MTSVDLKEKFVFDYIESMLNECFCKPIEVTDAKYHHNTLYRDASSVIQHGILPLREIKRLNIRTFSDETLKIMGDTDSHPNGIDGVSLAVVGLKDLYPEEYEFDPKNPNFVDILVSNDIEVARSPINYGNEFICYNPIYSDLFKTIDVRILSYLELCKKNYKYSSIENLISMYNYLNEIATCLKNKDILLREMSIENNRTLDIDKVSKKPKVLLKKD